MYVYQCTYVHTYVYMSGVDTRYIAIHMLTYVCILCILCILCIYTTCYVRMYINVRTYIHMYALYTTYSIYKIYTNSLVYQLVHI